ncbi:MAG TPA: DinB family protein [Saprospiraceae bacterium]|nr:DinB family protein [Saprospiraceae bacterium]HMP25002.1 DinB family protein [Saprospiraceae bacterium]
MAKFIFSFTLFVSAFAVFSQQNNSEKINTSANDRVIKTKKYNEETNLIYWPEKFDPKIAKFYVYNEIDINASPETVWNILIDATKWHTFYKGVEEPVEILDDFTQVLANNVSFSLKTMGIKLSPTIKEFIPYERMAWEVNAKNIQAYHAWLIVPTDSGCRLITPESQNGFLTFLQKVFQPNKLLNLHEHWLSVIKARAEETTSQLTNSEKSEMKQILHQSLLTFNNMVNNLSAAQLNFRAAPNNWSIAECIEHITLAEMEFPKILERALQKPASPEMRTKIKIKDDEIRPKMISEKWKAKSPEIFKPSNAFSSVEETVTIFRRQRNDTIAYIENTKDDLRNHFWEHPLTKTIDLYQTLILMSAHTERHINQIEQIKIHPNFPKL